jgi:mono/diheme cytochrome c family protein
MTPRWKWWLVGLGILIGLAVIGAGVAIVETRSQAILTARHPKPSSSVHGLATPDGIARGAHLTVVTACIGCHGNDLAGGAPSLSDRAALAPNLTRLQKLTDGDLDRAIRRGLRPDGTSELGMPSYAYASLTDDEVAAIVGYLRSLSPKAVASVPPQPDLLLRANLLAGVFKTATQRVAEVRPPIEAGPRFASGRHLAMVACGQCHGPDLAGGRGLPGPDLTVRGYYNRSQFHTLLRTGESADAGDMELMSHTARMSFSHFSDGEIDAIFDYLDARDRALSVRAPGTAR